MTRAAIYARYSSDLQSATSIDDQVRLCREHATTAGDRVVKVYTDHAVSGGTIQNRPGLQALLQDARKGMFDTVIAEALDRISRDQEDIAAIYKRLTHAQVRLVTLAEGEIGELHIGLKGTMNALFLKDLAQKTRRGQRGRVEAGKIPGGNSYGYRILRRMLADGTVSTGEREIDPEQATIVRRIFASYADGVPPRKIATSLNRDGIPSPRGGQWNASTINGHRQRRNGILNNELYIGRITYNRQRFVKDPDSGKRVARLNPQTEWVVNYVPSLRIIDDDLWHRVQTLKQRFASHQGNKRQTRKRLLSGLIACGRCGGGMTIARRDRYYCSARREKGTCDADRGIAASELEDRVMTGLKEILLGNEELLEEFAAAFREELARLRKRRGKEQHALTRERQTVERGIKRCLAFITEGDGDPGIVRDKLRALEERKQEIEKVLLTADSLPAVELHPNIAELYRRKVEELQDLLADENTRPQAMDCIRALIERIEVHPGKERGQCDVVLVGALAQILAFVQQRTTAASDGDGGTFLMVAGAGFEPATFRL